MLEKGDKKNAVVNAKDVANFFNDITLRPDDSIGLSAIISKLKEINSLLTNLEIHAIDIKISSLDKEYTKLYKEYTKKPDYQSLLKESVELIRRNYLQEKDLFDKAKNDFQSKSIEYQKHQLSGTQSDEEYFAAKENYNTYYKNFKFLSMYRVETTQELRADKYNKYLDEWDIKQIAKGYTYQNHKTEYEASVIYHEQTDKINNDKRELSRTKKRIKEKSEIYGHSNDFAKLPINQLPPQIITDFVKLVNNNKEELNKYFGLIKEKTCIKDQIKILATRTKYYGIIDTEPYCDFIMKNYNLYILEKFVNSFKGGEFPQIHEESFSIYKHESDCIIKNIKLLLRVPLV